MTITTHEQMREAAASDKDLIRRGDVTAIPMLGMTVTQIERAIRAIPIAPQPVAVTVKPLVDRFNVRLDVEGNTATAMMEQCQNGYWVRIYDYEALSALTIQPADPLSDPRVVALVEAVKAADTHIDKGHYEMARNITRAALRAIGGEA